MIASEKLLIDDVSDHLISAYTNKETKFGVFGCFCTIISNIFDFVFAFSMYMTFLYCYI